MKPYRLVLLAALLAAVGCGKKGPPRPPIRILPAPPAALSVRQIGDQVVIGANVPQLRTDGSPLGAGFELRILRLRSAGSLRPGAVSARYLERQFRREADVIAAFMEEDLRRVAPEGRLLFHDREAYPPAGTAAPPRYLYSVLVIDADGKRSPLPLPMEIELVPPAAPPTGLQASVAEGEVRLSWSPGADPGERTPRYNVYRWRLGDRRAPEAPLNRAPIDEAAFVDVTFRYEETYRYWVREEAAAGVPLRESVDSPVVEIRPLDRFPPAAPTGLAAAAEGSVIRLYWFPNGESDLAGYRIYRREAVPAEPPAAGAVESPPGPGAPAERLGEVGLAETSFTDATAVPGVRYYYAVTAFDGVTPPNESERSAEASEMLPAGDEPAATPGGEGTE